MIIVDKEKTGTELKLKPAIISLDIGIQFRI